MKTTVNPKLNSALLTKRQSDEEKIKDLKDSNKTKTVEKNTVRVSTYMITRPCNKGSAYIEGSVEFTHILSTRRGDLAKCKKALSRI